MMRGELGRREILISLGVGIQVGINRRLYYKIGEYSNFTRNTGFVFLIGRAKKRARKDIKGVYLLTINDDGGVMVSRMGTSGCGVIIG